MNTREVISDKVHQAFAESIESHGFVLPTTVVAKIAVTLELEDPFLQQNLEQTVFEYPAGDFLRDGALETIELLLQPRDQDVTNGGKVVIWTDDYSNRLASSIGDFRRRMSHEKRSRFGAKLDFRNKHSLVAEIAEDALKTDGHGQQAYTRLILVDDNRSVLNQASYVLHETMHTMGTANLLRHNLVCIDPQISEPSDYDIAPTYLVPSIRNLTNIASCYPEDRIVWAIDFNGPILDREAYIQAREIEVVGRIFDNKQTA